MDVYAEKSVSLIIAKGNQESAYLMFSTFSIRPIA